MLTAELSDASNVKGRRKRWWGDFLRKPSDIRSINEDGRADKKQKARLSFLKRAFLIWLL